MSLNESRNTTASSKPIHSSWFGWCASTSRGAYMRLNSTTTTSTTTNRCLSLARHRASFVRHRESIYKASPEGQTPADYWFVGNNALATAERHHDRTGRCLPCVGRFHGSTVGMDTLIHYDECADRQPPQHPFGMQRRCSSKW